MKTNSKLVLFADRIMKLSILLASRWLLKNVWRWYKNYASWIVFVSKTSLGYPKYNTQFKQTYVDDMEIVEIVDTFIFRDGPGPATKFI